MFLHSSPLIGVPRERPLLSLKSSHYVIALKMLNLLFFIVYFFLTMLYIVFASKCIVFTILFCLNLYAVNSILIIIIIIILYIFTIS
jgi:hypothetical protein